MCVQAEDGIRDLVRSRGLGDVYKRQVEECGVGVVQLVDLVLEVLVLVLEAGELGIQHGPVSYTHLTLPTSDLV